MTYAQIAVIVGCSIGTVRSRLHHAKLRLQDAIEGTGEPGIRAEGDKVR